MSGEWIISENSKTSKTGYVIASCIRNNILLVLTNTQSLPANPAPSANASTIFFNMQGYGSGITISYQVTVGTDVKVVLDANNDQDVSHTSWFSTKVSNTTSATTTAYLSTTESFRAVRIRIESSRGILRSITSIILTANS